MPCDLRKQCPGCKNVLSWALLAATPFLTLGLLSLLTGHNAFSALPLWSDELDYWRSMYSFSQKGLAVGYSGMYEVAPRLGTFSTHGFMPWLWYGGWAKLFGWPPSSIVLCNAVLMSLGLSVLILLLRPKAWVSLVLLMTLVCFPHSYLYAMTSMTELVNYALLAPYLACLVRGREQKGFRAAALLLGTLLTLYRITYFPLLLLPALQGDKRQMGLRLGLAMAASVVLYLLSSSFTAPFPDGFLYKWMRSQTLLEAAKRLWVNFDQNATDYFLRGSGNRTEDGLRWLYIACLLGCGAGALLCADKQKKRRLWIGFLLLVLALGMVLTLYDVGGWTDFRTLSPYLWFVMGYLLVSGHRPLPLAFAAGCAVLLGLWFAFPLGAPTEAERFAALPRDPAVYELCRHVEYTKDPASPFENSVRMENEMYDAMFALPAGVGIEFGNIDPTNYGQCRYVLTPYPDAGNLPGYEAVFTNGSGTLLERTESTGKEDRS